MVRKQKLENLRKATKKYRLLHPDKVRESARKCYAKYAKKRCEQARVRGAKLKQEVLTFYSPNHLLCCSWSGCEISDIDMLTLDHIENNGATERKERYGENKGFSGGSKRIYAQVKLAGFPIGYQTLCWNHQWKKEILRLRQEII